MKRCLELAEGYIKEMSIRDMAVVKICLLAAGILLGLAVPRKCKKWVAFGAMIAFTCSYVIAMTPFLKMLEENRD